MNHKYVVYITFYRGNKLPPFYVGKTTEANILKGYNGSVSSKRYKAIWIKERKEHPDLFKTVILQCFKTSTEALVREEFLHRFFDVTNNPMFINMSISNLIIGGSGENSPRFGIPGPNLGKDFSGVNNPMFGKKHSEESKIRMRVANTGKRFIRSEEYCEVIRKLKLGKKRAPFSKEWCKNMSISSTNRLHKPYIRIICPYCGKVGIISNMKRWHFDNCKFKE